jgi:hypothetical protein
MDDVFFTLCQKMTRWNFLKINQDILYHFLMKNVEVGNWFTKIFPREKFQTSKFGKIYKRQKNGIISRNDPFLKISIKIIKIIPPIYRYSTMSLYIQWKKKKNFFADFHDFSIFDQKWSIARHCEHSVAIWANIQKWAS